MSSSTSEAIRRWQAESLAKRLLEDEDVAGVVAAAFDLKCQIEFEEAVVTLYAAKERAIGRTCADGFADFSIQVDSALENTPRIELARSALSITDEKVKAALASRHKVFDELKEAETKMNEAVNQRKEVETCLRWLTTKKEMMVLITSKNFNDASKIRYGLLEELRHYPNSFFAQRLKREIEQVNVLEIAEQDVDGWMNEALDKSREVGFALLSADVDKSRTFVAEDMDVSPVKRFFEVARRDFAEERYAKHRIPALKQTLSSLLRATSTTNAEERIVRFRNALAEICGFFVIEKAVAALSQGELREAWKECLNKLVSSLESSIPDESQAETAAILACDFARTCMIIEMDYTPITKFFASRIALIRTGWMTRCATAVKDYCYSEMNKSTNVGYKTSILSEGSLPFTVKTVQELKRSGDDAKLLDKFTSGGFSSEWNGASPIAVLESLVVEKTLQEFLERPSCNLSDALYIFRASRELRNFSEGPSAYFETETRAREQIQGLFMSAKVDQLIVFQSPEDYIPPLAASTRFEPHQCVIKALHEIENAFNSEEAAAIPRELKATLLQETIGHLADRMEQVIFKDAPVVNPVSLKLFSLDLLAVDQAFPDHLERFSPMLAAILPFCTENGMENALMEASSIDRERILALLSRFRELDSSSRLFAPASQKKNVVDLREQDIKKYLTLFKS